MNNELYYQIEWDRKNEYFYLLVPRHDYEGNIKDWVRKDIPADYNQDPDTVYEWANNHLSPCEE